MSKLSKALLVVACAVLCALRGLAGDWVTAKLDVPTRQYCHEVHFPLGWQIQENFRGQPVGKYDFQNGDYEFRVPDSPGSKFLVRGFVPFLDDRIYTLNLYSVDLSDPVGIAQPAGEKEWNSALPAQSESREYDKTRKYLKSLGFPFTATGNHDEGGSLSPDRAVFIRLSWKGSLGCCGGSDAPTDLGPLFKIGRSAHGKLFFDAYSTGTGKKLVTVSTNFRIILPEAEWSKTGWVTGRYFLIPLDDRKVRCLVCDFGNTR